MSLDHRFAIAYHPDFLGYDFGPQHPLRPERVTAGLGLLSASGLWSAGDETLSPPAATDQELELVHDPAFVAAIKSAGTGRLPGVELRRFGLASSDNPAFPGMHHAAALVTGGSVAAVRQVMRGELVHAFNPAGGLHHALRGRASGFCIYNDPAVAAAVAVKEFGAKVLYLDFDCHHGDGVQWLFYGEPEVLTISFHESGRFLFPGSGDVNEIGEGPGRGYSVNIPMAPFTQDDSWIQAIQAIVPPLTELFAPDLVISSHGADTHMWDPLTHLALTTASFVAQARLVHELAHRRAEGRWLAVGSGGYDWRRVVPRSWSIVWAEMSGRELPELLPESWRAEWDGNPLEPIPKAFLDVPEMEEPTERAEDIARANQRTVRAVLRLAGLD
jgi:acetoin utilization protein AcuC